MRQILFGFIVFALISVLAAAAPASAVFDSLDDTEITILDGNEEQITDGEFRIVTITENGTTSSQFTVDGNITYTLTAENTYKMEYITENNTYSTREFDYIGGDITVKVSGSDLQVSQVTEEEGFVLTPADDLPGNELSNYGSYIGGLAIFGAFIVSAAGLAYGGFKYLRKKFD